MESIDRRRPTHAAELFIWLSHRAAPDAMVQLIGRLGVTGDPAAEPYLLAMLDPEASSDSRVVVAALAALAVCGTLAELGPVKEQTSGLFRDADVTARARATLKRLRYRLARAPEGSLTLSAEGGELSRSAEGGGMSVSD